MEITLSAVIEAARLRRAGITAEVAGYIVLLAVKALAPRPCHASSDNLLLTETGELRLIEADPCPPAEAEAQLRQLLGTLTGLAQSVTPALSSAAQHVGSGDLHGLQTELLAALIPINHAAARRALARLSREAQRVRTDGVPAIRTPEAPPVATPRPQNVQPTPPPSARELTQRSTSVPVPAGVRAEAPAGARAEAAALDIDVDVDSFDTSSENAPWSDAGSSLPMSVAATPTPGPVSVGARPGVVPSGLAAYDAPDAASDCRSDLRELLAGFLAHTRCDDQMAADLRKMIGL